jgi:hypothetical protein
MVIYHIRHFKIAISKSNLVLVKLRKACRTEVVVQCGLARLKSDIF